MKRTLTLLTALLLSRLVACRVADKPADKPNVILILADDLGYGDLSCYGNTQVSTPRMDSLAESGLRFTDAHTTSGVCTPSRYSLMTGRYCWRTFLKRGVISNGPALIESGRVTLGSVLQKSGYQTAMIGKWHLGFTSKGRVDFNVQPVVPGANEVGFNYSFLLPVGHFYPPFVYLENGRVVNYNPADPIYIFPWEQRGGKSYSYDPHEITPELVRRSLKFLEDNKSRPFFLLLATPNVHSPLTPSPQFTGQSVGVYGDYLRELDWAVGQVLDKLKALNLDSNTIVLFTSDNGASEENSRSVSNYYNPNRPLRGDKGDLYEGGHRMPLLVRWPGQAPAGAVSDEFIMFSDMLRTFASLVKQPLRPEDGPDGNDVLEAFRGKRNLYPERAMVIQSRQGMYGLRQGDWMYLHGPGDGDVPILTKEYALPSDKVSDGQLYNLREDLAEANNLAAQNPQRVEQMRQSLAKLVGPDGKPSQNRGAVFEWKDENHDGKLSLEEFLANQTDPEAAKKRFEQWDTDKDGFLSPGEFINMGGRTE